MQPTDADLRPEQQRALAYLRRKGTEAGLDALRAQVAATFADLEALLETVPPARRAARPAGGRWSVHEVVDHLVESHRPAVEQLRALLAGERPAGGPIPASLQSPRPEARPWEELIAELARIHRAFNALLASASQASSLAVTAPMVMVVKVEAPGGAPTPVASEHELDWKAFAQGFRVHTVEHRRQIERALAEPGGKDLE
jgi:hypothetical protein